MSLFNAIIYVRVKRFHSLETLAASYALRLKHLCIHFISRMYAVYVVRISRQSNS